MIASDMEANADDIISGLEKAFKNPMAEAVILDINSGGGSPVQSGAVYRAVKRLKSERSDLPVYAVIADVGASGAYYIAASADEIYADPASIVDPNEVAHMQALLDNMHAQFIKAVRDGRGERLKETPDMFSGLFWTGEQAQPLGLIDALGDKNTLRNAKYKDLDFVEYKPDRTPLEKLLRDMGAEASVGLRSALNFSEQGHTVLLK